MGSPSEPNFIMHAGGVSRLLEVRGPFEQKTGLEMHMACHLWGVVVRHRVHAITPVETDKEQISRCVTIGVPCFLAASPWAELFDAYEGASEITALHQKLIKQMVHWSDLTIDIRRFRDELLSAAPIDDLKQRLSLIKACLVPIDAAVEQLFKSGAQVTLVEPFRKDQINRRVFDFADATFAVVLTMLDGFALIIDRMLQIIYQSDGMTRFGAAESWDSPARRILRICQSYEYWWKRRPMGGQHMFIPLGAAFPHAETEEMRTWIVQALNELDEHRSPVPRFSDVTVAYLAGQYTGESPAFTPE